jgi:hypothetical protein
MARLKKHKHTEKEIKTGRNFVPSMDLGNIDFESLIPDKITEQALRDQLTFFKNYKVNPLDFFFHELGISTEKWPNDAPRLGHDRSNPPLWSKQREIVQALVKYRKVAVKSGHASGKSYLLARIVLYLAYAWHALGITTAPTFRQVKRVLWGEIHDAYNNAPKKLGGKLTQTSLELGDKWFVEGFSTKDPAANIAGFHEENIFVAIDEAGGVENLVFDVIEGILTSPVSYVVLIGNPLDEKGKFAEIFRGMEDRDGFNENSGFYCITINCYDTPNVKHGINLYPKLCDKDWPDKMAEKWGRDSNLFRVKVLGQFPIDGGDVLIPFKYIQRAVDNYEDYDESKTDPVITLGADIARFGADSTVIMARRRSGRCDILEVTDKERETETVGRIIFHFENFKSMRQEPACINVDDTGLGGGVVDMLWERGYPVNSIVSQEGADEIPGDDRVRFLNKRAQYYWKLRTAFHEDKVAINDWELGHELSKITTDKFLSEGKMKISDKDDLKKKIGRSPDRADCLMLCFAEDELISGQDLIAWA